MEIEACRRKVLSKTRCAPDIYDMWVEYPRADGIKPGQFADILCGAKTLRRPISICETDGENGRLRLVFEVRGEGTRWLSGINPGGEIDMLLPLGNGFRQLCEPDRAVFVGGGIGVPPLLGAAKKFGKEASVFLGFRSAQGMILAQDFHRLGCRVSVSTEDGTAGLEGLVTGPLISRLDMAPCGGIYACGPAPMLRAVASEAAKRGIPCLVSLEERMACGVGACLGCAVKIRTADGEKYLRVCSDGPVFDASDVVW